MILHVQLQGTSIVRELQGLIPTRMESLEHNLQITMALKNHLEGSTEHWNTAVGNQDDLLTLVFFLRSP